MTRTSDPPTLDVAPCLMQAARLQTDVMNAFFASRGSQEVTPAFFAVMWLLDADGTRPSVLAERAGVTKQAMSKLVKQMEQHEYLRQVPDPADTRAKLVQPTRRGDELKHLCAAARAEIDRRIVATLGEPAATAFKQQLEAVVATFTGAVD